MGGSWRVQNKFVRARASQLLPPNFLLLPLRERCVRCLCSSVSASTCKCTAPSRVASARKSREQQTKRQVPRDFNPRLLPRNSYPRLLLQPPLLRCLQPADGRAIESRLSQRVIKEFEDERGRKVVHTTHGEGNVVIKSTTLHPNEPKDEV